MSNLQGGEKYQQAFYVYEELAQAPATASIRSLVAQAVCELHLGRLEEAQTALEQALKKNPQDVDAIANMLVLQVVAGRDDSQYVEYVGGFFSFRLPFFFSCFHSSCGHVQMLIGDRLLEKADAKHQLLVDMEEKSALFDQAATKYTAKVSS